MAGGAPGFCGSRPLSGRGQQAFLLDLLQLGLRGRRRLLLPRRHLAGLVEDAEEDEDEDAHRGVADDGRDSPHGQARRQVTLHRLAPPVVPAVASRRPGPL